MTFSIRDAQALTYLVGRIREETYGCGKWDDAGTYAVLRELIGQNFAETLNHAQGHAFDPEARTPGSIRRPFIPKRPDEPGRRQPAKAGEDCKRHPGEYVGSCRACSVEFLSTEHDPVLDDDDRSRGRQLLAEIRARRAGVAATIATQAVVSDEPDDRPETACAAPECFRPTSDGICDRCRAAAIALDQQAANQALVAQLQANAHARAHTRPEPSPEPPRRFTSDDIDHDKVRAAMTRAAEQRSH